MVILVKTIRTIRLVPISKLERSTVQSDYSL